MHILGFTLTEFITGIIGLGAAVAITIKWLKDLSVQKRVGIQPNPKRCEDHEARLRVVETACTEYKTELGFVKDDIREIKTDVKELLKRP